MNNFARPGLGATELPPVNAEDNGKVLGVSDGAWAKVAAGGGSSLPTDPAQDGTYSLQNTVSSGTSTLSWESGGSSGGGVLMVHETISEGTHTLDKTWKQLSDAANAGTIIYYIIQSASSSDEGYIMYANRIVYDGVFYCAYFSSIGASIYAGFECETENGYPSYTE